MKRPLVKLVLVHLHKGYVQGGRYSDGFLVLVKIKPTNTYTMSHKKKPI